ncbi:MAG: DUF1326 domain-containing protein [Methanobacteriota archaeon]
MPTTWNFEAEFIQSCNCDYGCPCAFNGYPTHGSCEALLAYRIRDGTFDGTKLDGVTFAWGLWWPKAIHEGNGVSRVYIDATATAAQRHAVEEIVAGRHGGGVFEIFAKTFARVLPSKSAKIDFHYDGYDSRFSVDGIGEVRSGHVKNPVTGADFSGEVVLPGGLNFRRALVTAVSWSLHDGELQMDHTNRSGFATVTRYGPKGPVASSPDGFRSRRTARRRPRRTKGRSKRR